MRPIEVRPILISGFAVHAQTRNFSISPKLTLPITTTLMAYRHLILNLLCAKSELFSMVASASLYGIASSSAFKDL